MESRTDRQERISGWDQEKIKDAEIIIIGSDMLAQQVGIGAACIGFGRTKIVDNRKYCKTANPFLLFETEEGKSRARGMERVLTKFNPDVDFFGIHTALVHDGCIGFLPNENIIVDATNDPRSKKVSLNYGQQFSMPVILAGGDEFSGKVYVWKPGDITTTRLLLEEYAGQESGVSVSAVLGAIITDEIRKIINPLFLTDENGLPREGSDGILYEESWNIHDEESRLLPIVYNTRSKLRFGTEDDFDTEAVDLSGARIAVFGVGALGNASSTGLVLEGVHTLYLIDDDVVEESNLSRQPLFYKGVGHRKVKAAAETLSHFNLRCNLEEIVARVDDDFEKRFRSIRPDIIVEGFDNLRARAVANRLAVKYNIPLISAGTDFESGRITSYVPGYSACLQHQIGINQLAANEAAERARAGCALVREGSVIIYNQLFGGMCVDEAKKIFTHVTGQPLKRSITYSSKSRSRVGFLPEMNPCSCHETT